MLSEDSTRLEKIDKLYALRLDKYVSLPMLVVVGDQSSGKSSVLEGLTGLPFPRDAGLCTRFPTQVVFKRSATKKIEISIIPANFNYSHDGQGTGQPTVWEVDDLNDTNFLKSLSKACECMGVPPVGASSDDSLKSFSRDVLKIEMSGPDFEHFSVVDLPGIFRRKTTREDIPFVKKLIEDYIHNERCIILAVVPANVGIATQEIVQMAEDADGEGVRTLGVLTKPDLVDKGAEDKVLDLVTGRGGHFRLGYTMVCNRSQSNLDVDLAQRNEAEASFFSTEPWSTVPPDRAGIGALRLRLNKLLVELTRQEFRNVSKDISQVLEGCYKRLEDLGPERSDKTEQRNFLLRIAASFQNLTWHALNAYYWRDACFASQDELRLATVVKKLQEVFSDTMRKSGHRRCFQNSKSGKKDSKGMNGLPDALDTSDSSDPDEIDNQAHMSPTALGPDLQAELCHALATVPKLLERPTESINDWIRREYDRSKGFEIGTINPSVLPVLYHEQIRNWRSITKKHVNEVIEATNHFIFALLCHLCPDTSVRKRLWGHLLNPVLTSYRNAINHVDLLLQIEETGNMRTLNHYFAITRKRLQLDRVERRLAKVMTWQTKDDKEPLLRKKDILDIHLSNEDQAVEDLHDILQSYYKLSRKQFVDAVSKGAVDYLLLSVKDGPLRDCSPEFVGALSDVELEQIARESAENASERASLAQNLTVLQEGQNILSA